MKLEGTKFQIKVWKVISKIPKGRTQTYKEIAKLIGKPKASRAVANACGQNPYLIKIPCHRVIRSDGNIVNSYCIFINESSKSCMKIYIMLLYLMMQTSR